MSSLPCSWTNIHRHSIFSRPLAQSTGTPAKGKQTQDDGFELVDRAEAEDDDGASDSTSIYEDADEVQVGIPKQRIAVRDNDLILAIGKELRIMTVTGESWTAKDGVVGAYKTLSTPHLDFPINSLLLNPTKRLLAVVGRNRLVVVILPKTGWSSTPGELRCRSIEIDRFAFTPSSPTPISKVLWHPLGEGGQSLWVLTADGLLREYDLQSPTDHVQKFSTKSTIKQSKFSAVDPLSQYATSFTFSPPDLTSWGELAAHVLMANGDIHTLCPVLPLRTSIALSKLYRLKAYLALEGSVEEQKWLAQLVKQVPPTDAATAAPTRSILSRSTIKKAPVQEQEDREVPDRIVKVHPPHLTEEGGPAPGEHRTVHRQGPAKINPAPEEVEEEITATDLVLLNIPEKGTVGVGASGARDAGQVGGGGTADEPEEGALVLAMIWSNGRVDFGIEVEAVKGSWAEKAKTAPAYAIIDSIELGRSDVAVDAPTFSPDASSSETVYVQSATGVASFNVGDWVREFLNDGDKPIQVEKLVSSKQPMVGLISFTSTVLGYGLIALSSAGQVAAIELGDPYEVPVDEFEHASILVRSDTASAEDTHCLLLANTLDFPKAFDALKPPTELPTARSAFDKLPTARKPVTSISSETTRAIITHISALHHYIQAIRTESMALERHLDLQVKEYQRQLHSLKQSSERVKELQERQIDKRVAKLAAQQEALGKRTERVMKSMQEDLKPKAGPKEKRWFKELSDLEGKVKGKSGFGMVKEVPLEQRVRVAREQLDAVRASQDPVQSSSAEAQEVARSLGAEYGIVRRLDTALTLRSEELKRLMEKLEALTVRVESALDNEARGPSTT